MSKNITELLNINYPIIQGGMAWVAESTLAASVSNAGGLGIIAGGAAPIDYLREQIRNCQKFTDRPFGVNVMLMSPNAEDLAKLVIEEGVQVVTTGAGNPGKYADEWKKAGIKIIPVVPSVALAKRMEKYGADAVIAEGTESGGHIGETSTMCLVPQVVDAVKIPVIAAGGIADKRGVKAAFALGACGVQCGTVFLASEEAKIHENFKNLVLKAKDTDSIVTGRFTGHPCRGVKTSFARELLDFERNGGSPEKFEEITVGGLRKAVQDGNLDEGSFLCGAIAGLITEIKPVEEIIKDLFE
ncbi:2-nitropropane dioxygenase [Clostridia bacterium]|nr:2-nitropropane dioxygenase [Clostridia bacterium]